MEQVKEVFHDEPVVLNSNDNTENKPASRERTTEKVSEKIKYDDYFEPYKKNKNDRLSRVTTNIYDDNLQTLKVLSSFKDPSATISDLLNNIIKLWTEQY